jgi:hypothetical protein
MHAAAVMAVQRCCGLWDKKVKKHLVRRADHSKQGRHAEHHDLGRKRARKSRTQAH